MFWSIQGDAAVGVEAADEGRWWRSLGALEHREEEEEEMKIQGGEMERTLGLIYKSERISVKPENRGA